MKQFKNISTLIFDLGGVLINLDLPQCIQNFKELGLQNFEQHLSLFGQKGFFLQFEKGQISTAKFREEIRKICPNPLTDAQIDAAWCSFLCDIPNQKLEMLLELKKKFRLLLLSNTNQLHIEVNAATEFAKIDKKITDIFDKCYYSYAMGMAKPDTEIFEEVLKDAGVTAAECLFLDDGPKNTEQAAKMGIQSYLVDINEDLSFLLDENTWIKE
jgi:haloacid dehalogenase superfamily, subfamily IA, variant 3 with third motif having DD or ED